MIIYKIKMLINVILINIIVMSLLIYLLAIVLLTEAGPPGRLEVVNGTVDFGQTRRILGGREVGDTRPYMVYLRPASAADPKMAATNWLCGGVIIHERYILTSAACIEDAKHFYVVSGTHRWVPASEKSDTCVNNGAKKAIWKCVPKSYYYDGDDFDNIRWMVGDIAVVKVEDNFNFEKRVRGCDFIPKKIDYNNRSRDFEKAKTLASIAGWGSTDGFGDVVSRATLNNPELMETDVMLISTKNCKKRWDQRYQFIIDEHMICTKDSSDDEAMSAVCAENEVDCKELIYSDEEDYDDKTNRRRVFDPKQMQVHTAAHEDARRTKITSGGFCENDHGGPLVVGRGKSSMVVGIMSACMTRHHSHKCFGPYLFTSVFRHRLLITCAITKDIGSTCRRYLESSKTQISETIFDWTKHSDGPPKDQTDENLPETTTPEITEEPSE